MNGVFRLIGVLFAATACSLQLYAQNPYHINGNAYQENCNCYTLTNDVVNQSGSVWNINKIDLNQPFDFSFNIYLGCRDGDGADGIAFVLQPISTSIGSSGGGLGIQGVAPSLAITIDTWQNTIDNDPPYDHLAIQKNGDLNHNSASNLAGPVQASNINIEDCAWHVLHITWDPGSKALTAQIDNKDKVQAVVDMVATIFNGDPNVFWGFTGATGGSTNRQRFCTSLNAGIASFESMNTCFPNPVTFRDSSISFGSITRWFWEFGDGSIDSVKQPAAHIYPAPGIYDVKLYILGNNGCFSDTFRRSITIGSRPIANFGYPPGTICSGAPVFFSDSSLLQFGSIERYEWNVDNGNSRTIRFSPGYTAVFAPGPHKVSMQVFTREGCVSAETSRLLNAEAGPELTLAAADACINEPVHFTAANTSTGVVVNQWYLAFGDGQSSTQPVVSHTYTRKGEYQVRLSAAGANGCLSDTLFKTVSIEGTTAFAGNDTLVAMGQPLQLHAAGGTLYNWSPATGLSDPSQADPIAILQQDQRYTLTAYTTAGCASTDEIFIKVVKGPAFYVPNAFTPNGDGKNDRFRFLPVGMKSIRYFRVFNRFGQLVYSSADPAKGWDGMLGSKPQATGTYVWQVSGEDYNGVIQTLRGTVVLIR